MAANKNSKLKLLCIQRMLEEETDADHGLSMAEIIQRLAEEGIAAERKSIYRDLEILREFGLDIKARSGFEYTMISTLTNAHFGYLAVREAFDQGGYETTISGDTMMQPQTGYDLADTAVLLMGKMR